MDYIRNYSKTLSKKEKKFQKLIKGKKVVVIGPSPWLNGKKLGSYFDSFDVVVRMNQCIYNPKQNPEDHGSRTDIIYLSQRARDRYLDHFPKPFKETKYIALLTQRKMDDFPPIKFICYKCKKEIEHDSEYCLNDDWDKEGVGAKLGHPKCVYPDVNYYKYPVPVIKRDLAKYQKHLGHSLLTGLLSIIEMIEFEASELHIYGFDFYNAIKETVKNEKKAAPVSDIYCDGYVVFEGTLGMSHKDTDGQQFAFFKQVYETFKDSQTKMFLDPNLTSLMESVFEPTPRFSKYDNEFAEYIKGKKVVVVGPSPFLTGKKLGSYIDGFDVVVRPNLGYFFTEKNPDDFGKRTDVIYLNNVLRNQFHISEIPKQFSKSKFLVIQNYISDGTRATCKKCSKEIEKGQEYYSDSGLLDDKSYHYNCFKYIDYRLCQDHKFVAYDSYPLIEHIKETPLIGLAAIKHLSELEPSTLHITGFDFFHSIKESIAMKTGSVKYAELYSEGYQVVGGITIQGKDIRGAQLKEFRNIYKNSKIMTVDDKLQKLIK